MPIKDADLYREVIRRTGTFFFTTEKQQAEARRVREEKEKAFEKVELSACPQCKNRFWFDKKTEHECIKCGYLETSWQ